MKTAYRTNQHNEGMFRTRGMTGHQRSRVSANTGSAAVQVLGQAFANGATSLKFQLFCSFSSPKFRDSKKKSLITRKLAGGYRGNIAPGNLAQRAYCPSTRAECGERLPEYTHGCSSGLAEACLLQHGPKERNSLS